MVRGVGGASWRERAGVSHAVDGGEEPHRRGGRRSGENLIQAKRVGSQWGCARVREGGREEGVERQ